ncbi:DinB family protein [Sphingobacterium tabacisoli]|uniref:DinB family protein n=1 Tax=Sphingobacterium tabacisoli TaxID=2044855 RepID=A0ABW5L7M0_9SPHI|nr:DinB family protein [Sphingobacterium tabacisoli]
MNAPELIRELIEYTERDLDQVQAFKTRSISELQYKQNPDSWSILECIEHLNRYADFYIPELSKRIQTSTYRQSTTFKPGLLGSYFANSMLPREGFKKIKTFQAMNPINSQVNIDVLDKFIAYQQQLLALLEKSKNIDLTKVKTAISISKWIKLRLGDTFRVVVYHNFRHVVQCQDILDSFKHSKRSS